MIFVHFFWAKRSRNELKQTNKYNFYIIAFKSLREQFSVCLLIMVALMLFCLTSLVWMVEVCAPGCICLDSII